MTYEYSPKGVCSRHFEFDIEEGRIVSLKVTGGCNGNLKGISALVKGMMVDDAIERLSGIKCGMNTTSCPDQISKALEAYKNA